MLPLHAPILGSRTLHWLDEAACGAFAAKLATRPALADAFIERVLFPPPPPLRSTQPHASVADHRIGSA